MGWAQLDMLSQIDTPFFSNDAWCYNAPMTLENAFAELNKSKRQANVARQASDDYRKDHPEETDHYDRLLVEFNSTEDPQRKADIEEELANMDGINNADMPATWLEHQSRDLAEKIRRFFNREAN
jgi:hypothetical protein